MFFDMHADMWADMLNEYEKENFDIIRRKYKKQFENINFLGGIFVIWIESIRNNEETFQKNLRIMCEELHHSKDFIQIVKEVKDFYKAENENKFATILGIEGLVAINKNIDYIYLLEQLGIRHIGLTWNEENEFATGVKGNENRGLTTLGIEAVKIIEELKILLDVSHANDKTFWDIAKYSKKPFFASHSNARSICPSMRNLTDEQIVCIGERNGMIGLNSYHAFVSQNESEKTLDFLLNHLEYIAEKIGIDKVGFGLDLESYFTKPEEIINIRGIEKIKLIEDIPNIEKAMKKRGYSAEEIDMVTYKNFISFFERVRNS